MTLKFNEIIKLLFHNLFNRKQFDTLDRGIGMAKTHLTAMYNQVKEFLSMNVVTPRGGFLYVQMPEVCGL